MRRAMTQKVCKVCGGKMVEYENLPKYEFEFYEEMIMAALAEIKRLHNELAAPQQKKRKKSKWHPADERPMRSKSFPDYSVDVIGEVCDSLEVVYWNDHRKIWKGGLAMPKGVKRWRFLKKLERKGHDWQGEPWPDEGGEG
jgi:hypothetical protein